MTPASLHEKMWKLGFISWRRVSIIVGHLDCPHFNNQAPPLHSPSPQLTPWLDGTGPSRQQGRGYRREETAGTIH